MVGEITAIADLQSLLRTDVDMDNVTALSTRMIIISKGDKISEDSSGAIASGVLKFLSEKFVIAEQNSDYIHRNFEIKAEYRIRGSSATTFQECLKEFERVLRVENLQTDRLYFYSMTIDTWDTNKFYSIAEITFILQRQFEDVTS